MEEQALLATIYANPDDNAPRLIYADWLDEHDQPERAEFIRLQIERFQLRDRHPRMATILTQERALLTSHRPQWLGNIGNHFHPSVRIDFERGFPAIVRAGERHIVSTLKQMARLAGRSCLTTFKMLSHIGIEELTDLATSPHLLHLTALYLWSTNVNENNVDLLAQSPTVSNLKSLSILSSYLRVKGVTVLASSPYLAKLTAVNFWNNRAENAGAIAIAESPYWTNLRELYLPLNEIRDEGIIAIAHAPSFSNLQKLNLSHNPIGARGIAALIESPYLNHLTSLDLSFCVTAYNMKNALEQRFGEALIVENEAKWTTE